MNTTLVLAATGLLDAALTSGDGDTVAVAAVPKTEVACGMAVFPRPQIVHEATGEAAAVLLDLRAWLVTPAAGVTVPATFAGREAATTAAETLAGHVAQGRGTPTDPDFLEQWTRWWCAHRDDAELITAGGWSR